MKTVDDLAREAFQALLRGDTAERDRLIGLAMNVAKARERVLENQPLMRGEPILIQLPDEGNKQ